MLNDKKVIAVIPVRGGSKGIPGKNLYKLGKDSLLERTIKLAKKCSKIDQIVVSTDDDEMYAISKQHCVNTKEKRPTELASDSAKTIDVIIHVLDELELDDVYVIMLQVTSPLKILEDLNKLFDEFSSDKDAEAIVSLCAFDDPHPHKIQKIEDGHVKSYMGVESMVARQLLPKVYRLNGAFYLTHSDTIRSKKTFLPEQTISYLMPAERSVNLDTMYDLYLLEALFDKKLINIEEY
jgi:CMP-N,N'-diacetyllegionaminic acid synthase